MLHNCINKAYRTGDYLTAGKLAIERLKRRDRANWSERVEIEQNVNVQVSLTPAAAAQKVLEMLGQDVIEGEFGESKMLEDSGS